MKPLSITRQPFFTRQLILPVAFSLAGLYGCTVNQTVGPDISLVPVQYELNVINSQQPHAAQQLDAFIDTHWHIIAPREITFSWQNNQGRKVATSYRKKLQKRGLTPSQIHITPVKQPLDNGADLQVSVWHYQSITPICERARVDQYNYQPTIGCYTEGLRWKSIVNPEKAVNIK